MFIITDKESNAFQHACENLTYWNNGYPFDPDTKMAFVVDNVFVYEAESVPEYAVPEQCCFTLEDGFYPNPNYREPDPFDDPQFAAGYEQALLDLLELEEV